MAALGLKVASATSFLFTPNLTHGILATKWELQDGPLSRNVPQVPGPGKLMGPGVREDVIFTPRLFCCFSRIPLMRAL